MSTQSTTFELRDVVKRYGQEVEALRGLSLSGRAGEVVGLLGPNGAGKTTAIKCLVGLVRPTSGRATIQGEDSGSPRARRCLGYVPERPVYPRHLTAAELLDREGRVYALPRTERQGRSAALLERVGLSEAVARRRVRTYSKGEVARLGIAIALCGDPRVVLLDEPTDGLDPLGRRAVRELLTGLREDGRAVLLNSHLLSEVEACCDRVVILKAGRAIAQGTAADLLAGRRVIYRVRLAEPAPAALVEALGAVAPGVSADGAVLELSLADPAGIDAVIDVLRAGGAAIRELGPKAGLEDLFVELVAP